ncbi:MAG: hypothetical protein KDD62_08240, partial [Bdellovibrionales bacterium]|nr:hypothetical protein [Bdellovibrionales bacterium]
MEPAQNTNEALNSNQSLDPEKLASLREALAAQPIHRISREVQQTILQLLDAEAPLPEIALDYVFGDGMVPPTSATIECAKRVLAADESIVRETAPAITSILKLFHSKQGPRKNLDLSDDPIVAKHYQRKPGSFPAYQEVCEDVFIDAVAITQTYARNISTEIAIKSLTELRNYDRPAMLSWLSDLSQFPGDFNLLREFFNKAGTYNPFVAKDIMRVVIKRASSDEKLETETEEIASDKKVEAGQLASGGGLLVKTGDHFFALRPDRPEGAFARKRQAFGNIYDLISRGKDAAISTERKQARRDECLQDVISGTDPSSTLITGIVSELLGQGATLDLLKDVTLDAYLSDDTLQEIADRSPLLARNTRLYQELLAEVEALKEARVSLLGRENLYTLTSKNHRQFNILKNPSGTVLSVLGAMINDPSIDVPDSMQSIYHALTSSLSGGLSPAHERLYFAAASSWVGRHVYVERDLGLSDFIADVDYYRECAERKDKLPKDHPIHKG